MAATTPATTSLRSEPPYPPALPVIRRIVSGGQTGVDRAALDAALEQGFPCGGWCPKGRRAEDGPLPSRYPLREAPVAAYPARTARNVRDSDGTLILLRATADRGTDLTRRLAERGRRPLLILDLEEQSPADAAEAIARWAETHGVEVLNVAGPRESGQPGIYALALAVLRLLISAARLD